MALPSLIGPGLGWQAGRIEPATPAPAGSFVWAFGSELPLMADVEIGDEAHIEQDVDLTAIDLLTFAVRFRQIPEATVRPTFLCKVGGATVYELSPGAGDTEEYLSRTVNVSALTGVTAIRFELRVNAP